MKEGKALKVKNNLKERRNFMRQFRSEKGAVILEIVIALLALALIASIVVPAYREKQEKAYEEQCRSRLKSFAVAQKNFFEANGFYTASAETLSGDTLVAFCPKNDSLYIIEVRDSSSYEIYCPNDHGVVINGRFSWEKEKK